VTTPPGWTSADAAGLPILPGLVRYDEVVEQKEIRHGVRLKASVDISTYPANVQGAMKQLHGQDFEVVKMGSIITQ
jgi:hypothetical protein